jgi:hypothetical protein
VGEKMYEFEAEVLSTYKEPLEKCIAFLAVVAADQPFRKI